MLLALLVAPAAAQVKSTDWNKEPPPEGWSKEAYSPEATQPDFPADYDAPDGDDAYNAWTDPYHPLKNPDEDPGAAWNRPEGQNMPDNSPGVIAAEADWDWGEKYYDSEFDANLVITNNCETPQPVKITIDNLPYLTLPEAVVVPKGQTVVPGKVKLPPEPPPPLRLGLPGEPGWGHVEFPPIIIPPGMPPPKLHQPHFAQIKGEVVTWHPWTPSGGGAECFPKRQTYKTAGHIHFRPPPPQGAGGPEKLATPDVCQVWWNIGVPPAQWDGEDCSDKIRELARWHLDRVLGPYILNAPDEWLWLPEAAAIDEMTIEALLAMKARADALLGLPQ
ncbi:MAG: hypothetical protein WD928_17065 [Gammaproteobacteria bacterium]